MITNTSSIWIENSIRESIEESLKKEIGESLNNLKKEIQEGNTPATPEETLPEKGWQNTKLSYQKIETKNPQPGIDIELRREFDELNINRSSSWHIVEKRFSNSNAHWTYTEFEFNESLEKKDKDGNTYVEINWTKFYKVEYQKENWKTIWIIYKGKFISNEELKNNTEIMYTYSNLKWEAYWKKMHTVEISLMRWTCISWIQFCGTSIYRTDWNLAKGTNGQWKPIRQNKTNIL